MNASALSVLPLDSADASLDLVGGKARSLSKLAVAGLPVPPGFLLSTRAYRNFVEANGLQQSMLEHIAAVTPEGAASAKEASNRIQSLFESAELPGETASAILRAYTALAENEPAVAVRSSATAEDLPEFSFAGLHDTFLNVRGTEALLESLREGRKIFDLMTFGRFRIHNLRECNLVASQVAHLCPEPHRVVTGISELLINALEHGNLKIGYEEKSNLMRRGMWQIEVERRLNSHEHRGGFIELEFNVADDRVQIRIRDQGQGFDWTPYMDFDPDRAFDPHGRGIAVARLSSFDELEYIGDGNEVVATIKRSLDG